MISHPFTNLRAFQDKFDLAFITKADNAASDSDIAKVSHISPLASLKQKHGNTITIVRAPTSRIIEADGIVTDAKGLGIIIRFADCQNFVVYAPKQNVIGLIHAGWRGVIANVIGSFFDTLKREWKIEPADVYVGAGPSLCLQCADFSDPENEVPSLKSRIDGKHVDLIAAADDQLKHVGVPADRIERMNDCTRCQPETYWTYRGGHREEVKNGYTNCFVARLR